MDGKTLSDFLTTRQFNRTVPRGFYDFRVGNALFFCRFNNGECPIFECDVPHGKFVLHANALGISLVYTTDLGFRSSRLINSILLSGTPDVRQFLKHEMRQLYLHVFDETLKGVMN